MLQSLRQNKKIGQTNCRYLTSTTHISHTLANEKKKKHLKNNIQKNFEGNDH